MHIRPTQAVTESLTPGSAFPTVAAARAIVATWLDLTEVQRRDMISALDTLARFAGLPAGAVSMTPDRIGDLLAGSAPALGLTRGTRRNLRSRLRAVLRRIGSLSAELPPPSPIWQGWLDRLPRKLAAGIRGLGRYCTARDVAPAAVDEAALAGYRTFLMTQTLGGCAGKRASAVRLSWNRAARTVSDWPTTVLLHLPKPGHYARPLTAFPASFQADFEALFDRFGRPRDGANIFDFLQPTAEGTVPLPMDKPLRPASLATRRNHARWAASALVAGGLPIEQIVDLATLVSTENAKRIFGFLHRRAGNRTNPTIAHVAEMLRIIAKYHVRVPDEHMAKLKQLAGLLKVKYRGMTPKNERTVRAAMDPAREKALLALPGVMFAAAQELYTESPRSAAGLALLGLVIEILLCIPLRLANIQSLRLDDHLHRADPRERRITGLLISCDETKNGVSVAPTPRSL